MASPGRSHAKKGPQPKRSWGCLVAAGVVAAAFAGVLIWSSKSQSQHRREEALRQARNDRFAEAEPELRAALERDPNDVAVIRALARGYAADFDDIVKTEELLNRWVELEPTELEPLELRCEYYYKRRITEKTYADAKRLVELDPDNFEYRHQACGRAFDAGFFEESEAYCRECLKAKPRDVGLRSTLAQILRARRKDEEAARVLDELIAEDPKNSRALFARGILYQENGAPEKAIPMLRQVLELDPSRQRTAGYQLAMALKQVGESEEAEKVMLEVRRRQDVEIITNAIKAQPDNLELQVRFGASLLRDGHIQDGEGLLGQVLSRDPNFRPAHQALADHYEKTGAKSRAAKHRQLANQP